MAVPLLCYYTACTVNRSLERLSYTTSPCTYISIITTYTQRYLCTSVNLINKLLRLKTNTTRHTFPEVPHFFELHVTTKTHRVSSHANHRTTTFPWSVMEAHYFVPANHISTLWKSFEQLEDLIQHKIGLVLTICTKTNDTNYNNPHLIFPLICVSALILTVRVV